MTNLFDVSGKAVVLTGVNGQMGSAYAKALLSHGASVVGVDLQTGLASKLFSEEFPESFVFIETDVTLKKNLESLLATCSQKFAKIDCLINNAAIDSPPSSDVLENGPFESYPESSWDKVLNVNLKGVFLCCQIIGGAIAAKGGGSIINISSIYGAVSPDQTIYEYRRLEGDNFYKPVAYSASKSGLYNLTRYLATYWGTKSVRVNTLTLAGVFADQDPLFLERYNSRIPVGRMATPADYIGPILFLCSDASAYMTGSDMVVDGGWTAL